MNKPQNKDVTLQKICMLVLINLIQFSLLVGSLMFLKEQNGAGAKVIVLLIASLSFVSLGITLATDFEWMTKRRTKSGVKE